jgi:hypothetical protein
MTCGFSVTSIASGFAVEAPLAEFSRDPRRRLAAEVGLDQHVLEFFERGLVELPPGEDRGDAVGERAGGAGEAALQPCEEALLRHRFARFRGRRIAAAEDAAEDSPIGHVRRPRRAAWRRARGWWRR